MSVKCSEKCKDSTISKVATKRFKTRQNDFVALIILRIETLVKLKIIFKMRDSSTVSIVLDQVDCSPNSSFLQHNFSFHF
jgi:hypothetical protein